MLVREPKVPQYHLMIKSAVIFAVLLAIFYYATITITANSGFAETEVGKDTFKVVVTIFGITKETGDIVAIVNVDGNSRVKTFDLNPRNPSTYSLNKRRCPQVCCYISRHRCRVGRHLQGMRSKIK